MIESWFARPVNDETQTTTFLKTIVQQALWGGFIGKN